MLAMTFVGKLLVVIQLVMSICFMALAGTVFTRQDAWNKMYEGALAENETVKEEAKITAKDLSDLKTKSAEEIKSLKAALANQTVTLKTADETMKGSQARVQVLTTQVETHETQAVINADEAEIRRAESVKQIAINDKLHTQLNEKTKQIEGFQKRIFDMSVKAKKIAERYNEMLATVGLFKKALAANGLETDPKVYAQASVPPPVVDGEVVDTRKTPGRDLVEVSIGSDDGAKEGTILFVFRGGEGERNKYLGEIRLELVYPDKAVGAVINRAKNGQMQKGDHVTTKL
jgi:hypothetical protein